jgi:hypothetical protein
MSIVVEKNIPIRNTYSPYVRQKTFPFKDMEVGDSFWIEKSQSANVRSCVAMFIKRAEPDWKFITRKENDGIRVWRTE